MAYAYHRTNAGHDAGPSHGRRDRRAVAKEAADHFRRVEDRVEAALRLADAYDEAIAEHSPELPEDWVDE